MDMEFSIESAIGVLSERSSGWTKEINLISWGGKEAKFDIREWSPDHTKMGKGVTLSEDELFKTYQILKEYFHESATSNKNSGENSITSMLIKDKA